MHAPLRPHASLLRGVQLQEIASRQLRELPLPQRRRVAHVLEEMVAVVELTAPSIHLAGLSGERLHFQAAGLQVDYSINAETGLLTVYQIEPVLARAG